jgi:hypothetical protein
MTSGSALSPDQVKNLTIQFVKWREFE